MQRRSGCTVMLFVPLVVLLASTGRAAAEVSVKGPTGFVVQQRVDVPVSPQRAYEAFTRIADWWSGSHSFSGDAKNITLDVKPGGCWCEALPQGGFVRHMELVHAAPGSRLVFSGGLGPLQSMGVAGAMTVTFEPVASVNSTRVTLRYDVGGRDDKGFTDIAGLVDGVLGEQMTRYGAYAGRAVP
jgi:uncharacterized protein YndB with AHSA1/START domain